MKKCKVVEPGSILLARAAADAIAHEIDPEAEYIAMRGCIGLQKMSVTTANLEHDEFVASQQWPKRGPNLRAALLVQLTMVKGVRFRHDAAREDSLTSVRTHSRCRVWGNKSNGCTRFS